MTRGAVIAVGLVVLGLVSYAWMLADYRRERCPYTATDGAGRHLRVCYRGAHAWIPIPEGYDALIELRDASGGLIERRLVGETVDSPADIAFRFSDVRWDASKAGFVDNTGQPVLMPSGEHR